MAALDNTVNQVTQASTVESLELYESLITLKGNVQAQREKVIAGITPHRTITTPKYIPALVVAHDQKTSESMVVSLNQSQHPLFMRGGIAVRDDK